MIKISIIMPVFNSERFLKKSIESIVSQSYENWELIIIDDKSSDRSLEIINDFAKKDIRIKKYKNRENLGISKTRNKGIKYATGDYIVFCDDDDEFLPRLLEDNVKIIKDNSSIDMIKFGRRLICMNSTDEIFLTEDTKMDLEGLLNKKELYEQYFIVRKSDTLFNLWNGFYRKKLLIDHGIKFDEDMKYGGEDADFSYKCYLESNNIYINKKCYYVHYKRNVTSTSRKYNKNKILSVIKAMETEFKIWENIDFEDKMNQYYRIIAFNINVDNIMLNQVFHDDSTMNYHERKEVYRTIQENLLNNRYILNKRYLKVLFKNNLKHAIIFIVLNTNYYFLIDSFYKIAAKIKNKKWK